MATGLTGAAPDRRRTQRGEARAESAQKEKRGAWAEGQEPASRKNEGAADEKAKSEGRKYLDALGDHETDDAREQKEANDKRNDGSCTLLI
uniref:Uncharacterized protein n=1 Tax=Thermogemmatispora argillosa TaxID=2045280 RepID=A0A455T8A1_9CHLR|nr:hypothetical protein KTA_38830 [Thermogemmatispora argillosa]